MSELINSLKTFAYSGSINYDRRYSSGQLRIIPLLNLGKSEGGSSSDSSFTQWRDAMRMVARLPGGLPTEFRLKLWENLSERYLKEKGILWSRVLSKSAISNSRDDEIADQIDKDLHRTGCTGFSRAKQAKLKSVLVSYGRWNPGVGYCQGFNMIGAMLLEMTEGDETLTLKVLIFLIEGILPQGYFNGGLRGLAVDMAVFRSILKLRKPSLNAHLCRLQGTEEDPPLIDVFTMHWFLTLFIHCLPTPSVLRIWDLVLLEGSEVLLRTALVLWAAIETRILGVKSADEFYSVMGVVTREMLELGLMDPNSLVKCIVSVGPFPFPGLDDLRVKHRSLIQQDTPYKSFFLAKRELDNLKKHYAAIRHRQRATTIILKGLEASRMRVPGQRSNSLFIPTTKKQTVSPKPKLRRGSSGSKTSLANNNNNNNKNNSSQINNNNLNNRSSVAKGPSSQPNILRNGNGPSPRGKSHQLTQQPWEKDKSTSGSKVAKSFRRRRTLSASSSRSSSSSTELCDSSSDDTSSSEGVWSDSDNRWVKKSGKKKANRHHSESKSSEATITPMSIKKEDVGPEGDDCETQDTVDFDPPSPAASDPGRGGLARSSSIIDTNDSQHFLEEMSKLGKSDSFYENLSKRICELQFQNLKTLNSCTTVIDPKSLALPPFEKSPLPSPISPYPPVSVLGSDILEVSRSLSVLGHGGTPRHLSPRGSLSSATESPLPRSPMSPTPNSLLKKDTKSQSSSLSRRTSKSSVSSAEIPGICILGDNDDNPVSTIPFDSQNRRDRKLIGLSPEGLAPLELPVCSSLPETPNSPLVFSPLRTPDFLKRSIVVDKTCGYLDLEVPVDGQSVSEPSEEEVGILGSIVTVAQSPQKRSMKLDLENCCLVSPSEGPPPFNKPNHKSQTTNLPRPKNFPVSPVEEAGAFLFHHHPPSPPNSKVLMTEDDEEESTEINGYPEIDMSPTFPTATCPCQCQTTEEINAVIRENIAILQRLKLNKPAYLDDDEEEEEDCSYEDVSSCGEDGGATRGSSDRDSGLPSSSKTSLTCGTLGSNDKKERLSSVSSNASTGSRGSCGVGRPRGKSLTRTASLGSSKSSSTTTKSNFGFNPFPTVRKARLRASKYGLYN